MRVLFVSSGNHASGIGTVVANQARSIEQQGIEVTHFGIRGGGAAGYLQNVARLRRLIRHGRYDVVHAHYSLSGIVAALAGASPLVVSLMGSDAQVHWGGRLMIRLLDRWVWSLTIVKSARMARRIGLPDAPIIPNGVALTQFSGIDRDQARKTLAFDPGGRHVIFVANPARPAKDYALAQAAFTHVRTEGAQMHIVADVPHERIPVVMAAADALLLTSVYEGSPNVIKEAMAACLPIVSTDVGDVREVIGATEGCYVIAEREPAALAEALDASLGFGRRTNGMKQVLHFDAHATAAEIVRQYKRVAASGAAGVMSSR